ncbi:MAG: hypothetical protein RM368_00260 [Nostoc sp. DedSLP03]|nr:hypothetical protein [Nostoc sp. DedSLP03]
MSFTKILSAFWKLAIAAVFGSWTLENLNVDLDPNQIVLMFSSPVPSRDL